MRRIDGQPQAERLVRAVNDKRRAGKGEPSGQSDASDTSVSHALRGADLRRDGLRLAAWLLGALFYRSGWTQEQLAKKEGRKQQWVARQLCFGRFLAFSENTPMA